MTYCQRKASFDFTPFLFKKDVFRKEKHGIVTDMKRKRYICSQFSTDCKNDLQYGNDIKHTDEKNKKT